MCSGHRASGGGGGGGGEHVRTPKDFDLASGLSHILITTVGATPAGCVAHTIHRMYCVYRQHDIPVAIV